MSAADAVGPGVTARLLPAGEQPHLKSPPTYFDLGSGTSCRDGKLSNKGLDRPNSSPWPVPAAASTMCLGVYSAEWKAWHASADRLCTAPSGHTSGLAKPPDHATSCSPCITLTYNQLVLVSHSVARALLEA